MITSDIQSCGVTCRPKRDEREKLIILSLYIIVYHYVSLIVIACPRGLVRLWRIQVPPSAPFLHIFLPRLQGVRERPSFPVSMWATFGALFQVLSSVSLVILDVGIKAVMDHLQGLMTHDLLNLTG